MKKLLSILGGLVLVVVAIVAAVFALTSGVTGGADDFFKLVKSGEYKAAYESTSKEFQKATSMEQFTDFLNQTTMVKFDHAEWTSRSMQNNLGNVEGTVVTTDKGVVPVTMDLVNEDGKWKVLNLRPVVGGLQPETASTRDANNSPRPDLPSDDQVNALVTASINDFVDAVKAKDFNTFYDNVSEVWKAQTNAGELEKAFEQLMDEKVDLGFVKTAKPVLNAKPELDQDNILVVDGTYPSKDANFAFHMGFVYEHPNWKLIGISVNLK